MKPHDKRDLCLNVLCSMHKENKKAPDERTHSPEDLEGAVGGCDGYDVIGLYSYGIGGSISI